MKNWKKDLNKQIAQHIAAYNLQELPYQRIPETTFDEILESQVSSSALENILQYMH
jgi:hypothetical protein